MVIITRINRNTKELSITTTTPKLSKTDRRNIRNGLLKPPTTTRIHHTPQAQANKIKNLESKINQLTFFVARDTNKIKLN